MMASQSEVLTPRPDPTWSLTAGLGRLWSDHVIWTRDYVVLATSKRSVAEFLTRPAAWLVRVVGVPLGSIISRLGFADAAAVRLLRNQHDLGHAIVPLYGSRAGAKLRRLLKKHITIAVKMVSAARADHERRFARLDAKWTRNAEKIAELLAAANPNWHQADVVDLLAQHLALTKQEVQARLRHQWDADVDAFDQIYTEILTVAGVLADGIVKQFPDRFPSSSDMSPAARSLRLAMRRLWSDHVIWTREYLAAAVADRPDAGAAAKRLLKNQEDIGAAVAAYYGEAAGTRLTDLLKEHITTAVEIIDAAKSGDDARFRNANADWDRNAAEIADFLSSANPQWPRSDVLDLLMQHLNLTRNEVTARIKRKRKSDVDAFDQIHTEILTVADVLTDGLVKQFPERF
jgi:hypothetical protein